METSEPEHQHFDTIADQYLQASETWHWIYDKSAEQLRSLTQGKDVLDVGNGGVFAYDTGQTRKVIAMDTSPAMLDGVKAPNVSTVVGDARELPGIEDESVDVVIFMLLLHHINGRSVGETKRVLDQVLEAAFQKIRPGGHLVIVEPVIKLWLYPLESLMFPVTKLLLRCFGVSMIFFYSLSLLRGRIGRAFGTNRHSIDLIHIQAEGAFDPLGGSFPGIISIPPQMSPTEFYFLQVQKAQKT